jgi:hypothetical protein
MNSSRRGHGRYLAKKSSSKLEAFLLEIANLNTTERNDPENVPVVMRLAAHYREFFPSARIWVKYLAKRHPATPESRWNEVDHIVMLGLLKDGLRAVWKAQDRYSTEWCLASLRFLVYCEESSPDSCLEARWYNAPPRTPIQQALIYLGTKIGKLHTCAIADCNAPYYFAKRRTDRYCGNDDCASRAQRAAKKAWWNKYGKEWRAKRNKPRVGARRKSL